MSEYAGTDPRVAAAEETVEPPEDERDATQVMEDPAAPPPDAEETYR